MPIRDFLGTVLLIIVMVTIGVAFDHRDRFTFCSTNVPLTFLKCDR